MSQTVFDHVSQVSDAGITGMKPYRGNWPTVILAALRSSRGANGLTAHQIGESIGAIFDGSREQEAMPDVIASLEYLRDDCGIVSESRGIWQVKRCVPDATNKRMQMGLSIVFVRRSGDLTPVPKIPRIVGHLEFIRALDALPSDGFPCGDLDNAWRPISIPDAVQVVKSCVACQTSHLRILWQLRHDPDLYLWVSN